MTHHFHSACRVVNQRQWRDKAPAYCRAAVVRVAASLLVIATATMLAACGPTPPAVTDRYDPAKMDLKPAPAKLSSVRHTGPFAVGPSLNMTAELKPIDPSPVKVVQLDTTHKVIEIAPGVKFSAWTFGDQVPGPAIRARVGRWSAATATSL